MYPFCNYHALSGKKPLGCDFQPRLSVFKPIGCVLNGSFSGLPVGKEFLETGIREGMGNKLFKDLVRHGASVRARESRGLNVHRRADAGCQHVRVEPLYVVHLGDLSDEVRAVLVDVIEATDERADEVGAGTSSQERLVDGETEGNVDLGSVLAQLLTGAQSGRRQRHFDDNIFRPCSDVATFFNHAFEVLGYALGAHGTAYDLADLLDKFLKIPFFLNHQRWVGSDAVENAPGGDFLNLVQVCGVQK